MNGVIKYPALIVAAALFLASCSEPKTVTFKNIKLDNYKIVIRDMEFLHSGLHNTNICVSNLNDTGFPNTNGFQCFFSGYDFVGLEAKWRSSHVIDIVFKCGTVTSFSNFAIISKNRKIPVDFHVFMHDDNSCKSGS